MFVDVIIIIIIITNIIVVRILIISTSHGFAIGEENIYYEVFLMRCLTTISLHCVRVSIGKRGGRN